MGGHNVDFMKRKIIRVYRHENYKHCEYVHFDDMGNEFGIVILESRVRTTSIVMKFTNLILIFMDRSIVKIVNKEVLMTFSIPVRRLLAEERGMRK